MERKPRVQMGRPRVKPEEKKIQFPTAYPPALLDQLNRAAYDQEIPAAEVVRRAVKSYLANHAFAMPVAGPAPVEKAKVKIRAKRA